MKFLLNNENDKLEAFKKFRNSLDQIKIFKMYYTLNFIITEFNQNHNFGEKTVAYKLKSKIYNFNGPPRAKTYTEVNSLYAPISSFAKSVVSAMFF